MSVVDIYRSVGENHSFGQQKLWPSCPELLWPVVPECAASWRWGLLTTLVVSTGLRVNPA